MKVGIVIGSIVIVVIVIIAALSFSKTQDSPTNTSNATQNTETSDSVTQQENAKYLPYGQGVLENASNKRRVLFFYANWCPTCKPADASFGENTSKIPDDVVVIRINYNDSETDDEEKALARKYEVTYQHTFVQIDSSGNKIKTWNGGKINELLSNIQ